MQSSSLSSVLRSLTELREPVRVSGIPEPAQAFLITQCLQVLPYKPFVIFCADLEKASELTSELQCYFDRFPRGATREIEKSRKTNPKEIYLFPTWDPSPYTSVTPSIKTRLDRLTVFSRLSSALLEPENFPQILIVTTLEAACQSAIPPQVFEKSSISLAIGNSIGNRQEIISRLQDNGYLNVDPVEDPGTFAVRGEIIDLFPSDRENPLRMELFDDVIENIREFDPSTQRTRRQVSEKVRVPPAREVLINSRTSVALCRNLKTHSDDHGISKSVRDPLIDSIQNHSYPERSDAWAPFAYSDQASLINYLPSSTEVIWMDEHGCLQNLESFLTAQAKLSAQADSSGRIVPPVEALFPCRSILPAFYTKSRLYLDRIEWEGSNTHRFHVVENRDLIRADKHSLGELEGQLRQWMKEGYQILIFTTTRSQLDRIQYLLTEHGFSCRSDSPEAELSPQVISLVIGELSAGFRWHSEKLAILTEGEILGTRHVRKINSHPKRESGSALRQWSDLQALSDLSLGDAVVHIDHGIALYQGLARLDLSGAPSDFLLLQYANKDKLYVPVYRLNTIQKYIGSGESVSLDRLGSSQFSKTKEKVRDAVKKLAFDLVQLHAERKIRPGILIPPPDVTYREFEASFPFDETPDQLKAIEDVGVDLESGRPMDRLICGDVGYGKTEVAIRAAFRAASHGKQVAVLVPTTVLALQHEQSFKARLGDYPFIIESVSRFKNREQLKAILLNLSQGKVDIIIGTHRLLSKDVDFHNLGLVVVDEEHRFGVEHKERLKALRSNVHILTLSATPIPRTLHMSLSGLRDISLINTPPADRLPIRTAVSPYDETLIQRALEFEFSRGGQAFYVHNRVQSIEKIAAQIRKLIPSARVQIAHGQMNEKELEKAMMAFYHKEANVLVCTTLIESGLDLPSANTIIIDRADTLGLSQLYQIRGRVGRSQERAYAYLMVPPTAQITETAKQRLEVMQRFVELGSGFSVASHDLEIRGGGDLLGPNQSGHVAAVGFDLYTELLEEAIQDLQMKGKGLGELDDQRIRQREPEIKIPFPAFLSEEFIPDIHQRLSLYRRFSSVNQDSEIDVLEEEIQDRFGTPPSEAQNLFWLIRIKLLLKTKGIDALTVGPEKVALMPGPKSRLNPVQAIALVSAHPKDYQLMPDSKLVAKASADNIKDLFFSLENLLSLFANYSGGC